MIISSPDDYSTNDIIDWLRYYQIDYLRISVQDIIKYEGVSISNDDFDMKFSINEVKYCLSAFGAFWYRRSHFNVFIQKILVKKSNLSSQINKHLYGETMEIHKLLLNHIEARSINNYKDINLNKLEVLKAASNIGFKIPNTIITNNKKDALSFINRNNTVITKNFSQGVFLFDKKKIFSSITRLVTLDTINSLPEKFMYTLFQEGIDKLFELRIFYLRGKFYSSAIFSQNDEKTAVDFRNYNFLKPNRSPPYKLPEDIANKLKQLMDEFELTSGSIDLLVSKSNEYVFLEVNPIGQFTQVSLPCNYYLEKKIANELITIAKNENLRRTRPSTLSSVRHF